MSFENTANLSIKQPRYNLKGDKTQIEPEDEATPVSENFTTNKVTTELPIGQIKVIKQNSVTNSGVSGARIGIYSNSDCKNSHLVKEVTTGSNGTITSENLDIGTYYVKEIEAPANYVKDDTVHTVKVTTGNITEVTIKNTPYGKIKIKKVDSQANSTVLANAVFNIYSDSGCTQLVQSNLKTNTSGTVTSNWLEPKAYWIKEITAPDNYALSTQATKTTVQPGETIEVTIKNTLEGQIKITKTNSVTSAGVSGARIGIYSNKDCSSSHLVKEVTTGSNGTILSGHLDAGTYYVKEIEAPANYVKDNTVHEITVSVGKTTEVPIQNTPYGQIKIIKRDGVNTGTKLANAVFSIYSDANCTKPVQENLKTASDGTITSNKLEPNKDYWVKEITAPANYVKDNDAHKVTVQAGETVDVTIDNTPYGQIRIVKRDSVNTGTKLANAVFSIYSDADCTSLVQGNLTTASDGTITSNKLEPNKDYWVKEITAPEYYVKDNNAHKVTVQAGKTVSVTIDNIPYGQIKIIKIDSINTSKKLPSAVFNIYSNANCTSLVQGNLTTASDGTITSNKLVPNKDYWVKEITAPEYYVKDDNAHKVTVQPGATVEVTVQNIPYGQIRIVKRDSVYRETPVANAVFNIYSDSGLRTIVDQNLTTNADGTITSKKLVPNQKYWVKEITPPQYYVAEPEAKEVTVQPGAIVDITIYDIPYGQIRIVKRDSVHTTTPVANAVFNIYSDVSLSTIVDQNLRTGADGTITSKKLIPNQTYYVKEITPPQYYVPEAQAKPIVVQPGITVDITIYDIPYGWIEISKTDTYTKEALAGATFKIYQDESLRTEEPQNITLTTGSNGKVKTDPKIYPNKDYWVKEQSVPYGYVLDTASHKARVNPDETTTVNISNKPWTATIEVSKLDNQTGRIVTKENTEFALYEWSVSANTWVKPTHVLNMITNLSDGTTLKLNEKVSGTKGTYTGTIYYNKSNDGRFKIVEYTRPFGYTNTGWSQEIRITADGQVFRYNTEVRNEEVRGQINLEKKDYEVNYKNTAYGVSFAQGDSTLRGAIYALYARENIVSPDNGSTIYTAGTEIQRQTTDNNGRVTWDNLYLGKYYIKEVTPSEGYLKDDTTYEVDLLKYYQDNYYSKGNQSTQKIVYKTTATDVSQYENSEQRILSREKVKKQSFQLTKLGISEDSTMGDPLEGAGFKIYLIKDLSKVKDGTIKPDSNGNYKAEDFRNYDFSGEQTALSFTNNINGTRIGEIKTNSDGIVVSPELAYGQYIVIESTTPSDHLTIHPFIVKIEVDSRTPKKMVYPLDRDFEARIKIVKKDDSTNQIVLKANAAYRIWSKTENKYIEQFVAYPNKVQYGTENNPYRTTEEGYLITPEPLTPGEYEIREVEAPEGYVLAGKESENKRSNITFTISTNSVYEVDNDFGSNNAIIPVEQYNTMQRGNITVTKQGEFLSNAESQGDSGYNFEYTTRAVPDAKFAIYAKEDIYTQDNQKDESGNRNIIYAKDQLIREVETNSEGKAVFEKLPLGKYYIKETKAGNGFVLNQELKEVELTYEGQDKAIILRDVAYTNERQKIEINVTKKDREEGTLLAGAEFGLYTKEEIHYIDNSGTDRTIPKDTLIQKVVSGENGVASINNEKLPLGKYYIKELKAPKGYATSSKIIELDCTYTNGQTAKIVKNQDFTNQIIKLKIRVLDYETDANLVGTEIELKDEEGNTIGTYTIDENGEIEVKGLEVGKQYSIQETKQKTGYVKDLMFRSELEDAHELIKGKDLDGHITFVIKDSEEFQRVTLRNIAKVGTIEIEKIGDVLVGAEKDENGEIEFKYETQKIDTAKFEIYTEEDIVHPDGKTGIIVEKGIKIAEGQTENGILTITKFTDELIGEKAEEIQMLLQRGLPLGEYEIREIEAPKGYYNEGLTKTITVESTNDNDQIERAQITISNPRQITNAGTIRSGISIEKEAEKEVYKAGEEIIYTIKVINTGNTVLKDVEVKETMIDGEFDEQEGITKVDNNTVTIARLEISEEKTLTYRYTIPEGTKGEIDNKVTAIATPVKKVTKEDGSEVEEEQERVKNEDDEKVWTDTIIEKEADDQMYVPGEIVQYTLNITNPNDEAIENAIIRDEKVTVGSIIKASKEGISITQDGIIEIERVEARERIEIVYWYKIPEDYLGNLTNEAIFSGTIGLEEIPEERTETTVQVKKSGVEIEKEAEKETYMKGETVNYTIKVTNTGETTLYDVMVKENLLDGKFVYKTGIEIIDNQTVKIAKLERGETIKLVYQYTVGEEKLIEERIENKVTVTATGKTNNPDDPANPILEEVSDEADEDVTVKEDKDTDSELGIYKTDIETGEAIPGVIFGIYTAEDILGTDGSIILEKDTLIERSTTDQNGYARFRSKLPIGKFYIIELKPAKGYIKNNEKIEIDSTEIGGEKEYPAKLETKNKKTEINIEKIEKTEDLSNMIRILGAKLQIVDEEGNVIEEWITDETAHNIKGLETEKVYKLHEVEPGRGYVTAKDIEFEINIDGSLKIEDIYTIEDSEIPTIVMQDDVTRVKVDIVDKETKEPVKDVEVQVKDKKTGEVVYEFTTDGEEHIIEKLPIGDYEIVEKSYPKEKGYVSVEVQDLTVNDTPEVQEKVIEQDYTKLDVSFVDELTKDLIPGGKLELRNEKGEVVAEIDDTGVHWYKERLEVGKYTLVETVVPEGYEPTKELEFMLEDTPEIQYVVMENIRLPFDLKVEKYASKITLNGKKATGASKGGEIAKVEIPESKLSKQKVQIEYIIKVTNVGKVTGKVGRIEDKIPSGLKFDASKNETYWVVENKDTIVTTKYAETEIKPGESIELKIVLDWTNNIFNLGQKINRVTIGEITNNPGFEDIEPGNNIAEGIIIVAVKTGAEIILAEQILIVVIAVLAIMSILGVIEIKVLTRKKKDNTK